MFSLESEISLWIKPKREQTFFAESLDPFRRLEVRNARRQEMFLWWACVYLTTRYYTTSHQFSSSFFDFARICTLFSLVFRTSKFLEFKKFNKTIIPFALVEYETGYSQLGATRLVGYLPSHPTRAHGIIVNYSPKAKWLSVNIYRDEVEVNIHR